MGKTRCGYLICMLLISIFIIACKDSSSVQYDREETKSYHQGEKEYSGQRGEKRHKPALANPAATRCVNDGYTLEPVIENGVSVDYLCVDPETGLKCEIWKYFRHECSLEK